MPQKSVGKVKLTLYFLLVKISFFEALVVNNVFY